MGMQVNRIAELESQMSHVLSTVNRLEDELAAIKSCSACCQSPPGLHAPWTALEERVRKMELLFFRLDVDGFDRAFDKIISQCQQQWQPDVELSPVKESRSCEPNKSENASVNGSIFNSEYLDGMSDRGFSEHGDPQHGSEQMDVGADDQVREQVRALLQAKERKQAATKIMEHFKEQLDELRNNNKLKRSSGEFTWEQLADHGWRRTICYTTCCDEYYFGTCDPRPKSEEFLRLLSEMHKFWDACSEMKAT